MAFTLEEPSEYVDLADELLGTRNTIETIGKDLSDFLTNIDPRLRSYFNEIESLENNELAKSLAAVTEGISSAANWLHGVAEAYQTTYNNTNNMANDVGTGSYNAYSPDLSSSNSDVNRNQYDVYSPESNYQNPSSKNIDGYRDSDYNYADGRDTDQVSIGGRKVDEFNRSSFVTPDPETLSGYGDKLDKNRMDSKNGLFKNGLSRYVASIAPNENGINKQSSSLIAAAGLAAGAAVSGGGAMIYKNNNLLHFTPEDWMELGEDYHSVIETLMKKVGFDDEEMERFKTSRFAIEKSEMREHTKKIQKALKNDPSCDDEYIKLYNYSFYDETGKVNDYLLFITMLIDGKKYSDEYNIYNVINQALGDSEDANYIYSGINMDDYFDPSTGENEKVLKEETQENSEESMEEQETAPDTIEEYDSAIDKEWLKGIGLDD